MNTFINHYLALIVNSSFFAGFVIFFQGNKQYKYDFDQNRVVSVTNTNELMDCKVERRNNDTL